MSQKNENTYILFKLGGETFGTRLLSVREIVEMQPLKPVPFTSTYFLGVLNIKGKIISVLDLQKKFKLEHKDESTVLTTGFILILDLPENSIGVRVDSVLSVRELEISEIAPSPINDIEIDPTYLIGVSRVETHLACLIELNRLISNEEMEKTKDALGA